MKQISAELRSDCRDLELLLELFLEILETFKTAKEATYLYMMSPLFHSRYSCLQRSVSYVALTSHFLFSWRINLQDPVVDAIKAAADRLTHSTHFLNFMAQHAFIMHEELPSAAEEPAGVETYHFMSLLLNLASTFLYMVNTYIIVPTADDYSMSLGAAPTVCGVIIGAMAIAQIFSSVYLSAWSNKSYFGPLVFSSLVLCAGNVMYAMAYDLNSIAVLLIGRLLCG